MDMDLNVNMAMSGMNTCTTMMSADEVVIASCVAANMAASAAAIDAAANAAAQVEEDHVNNDNVGVGFVRVYVFFVFGIINIWIFSFFVDFCVNPSSRRKIRRPQLQPPLTCNLESSIPCDCHIRQQCVGYRVLALFARILFFVVCGK